MIESLRRSVITVALLLSLIAAGARAVPATGSAQSSSAAPSPASPYETRAVHDPNGTGKFYMGREIAQVMGAGGIPWLDRDEREKEEQPTTMVAALGLHSGEVVADLGAGSGRISFMMAPRVAPGGKVYAVDIQEEMLRTSSRARTDAEDHERGSGKEQRDRSASAREQPGPGAHGGRVPRAVLPLRDDGERSQRAKARRRRVVRVRWTRYRKEDPSVPIKEVHKMSVDQLEKEMRAIGLVRVQTIETLPIQHIVFFEKRD